MMRNTDRLSTRSLVVASLLVLVTAACDDGEEPRADAGPADAGEIDAGVPDAGEIDAGGVDGGSIEDAGDDAGEVDAGVDAGPIDSGLDAGPIDAGPPDSGPRDSGTDAGPPTDGGPVTLVPVSHPRELRAIWLTTVFRLDFPSAAGISEVQARAELTAIADLAAASGLNAILFQVRPESDALYTSTLEPWSRFLTGAQGVDPGWDPLALILEIARPRGLEVHAWVNPYRALTATTITAAPSHVTQRFPSAALTYNNAVVMDPSDVAVRAHIISVVTEIVSDYDVDGVVFDDYFYPYPDPSGTPFPDSVPYGAYVDGGGTLSLLDWRRDNVNRLVSGVSAAIKAVDPGLAWGVAPFGIYRPGMPPGVTGTDAYNVLAADSVRWINEGWVDYLAPQLYWSTISTGQPFGALVAWWSDRAPAGRYIHPSLGLYRLGTAPEWTTTEMETEVSLTRAEGPQTAGHTWFRYDWLNDDAHGERAMFARIYDRPARPPATFETATDVIAPPLLAPSPTGVTLSHPDPTTIRGYAVYRDVAGAFQLDRWIPSTASTAALPTGRYAISAIARGGAESLGVEVVRP